MQTVILAGGVGKRVYPLSASKPKPMLKLLGKPLLHHVIDNLKEAGLKEFIIVTGHHADQIKSYFGDGSKFGVKIKYTYQENPEGMADAIMTVENLVKDSFLVVNGDDIFESYLIKKMIDTFRESDADLLLSSKSVKETWKFGIIKASNDGSVERIVEKPPLGKEPSNLAVIGAYILPPGIFNYYRKVPLDDSQHENAIQKIIEDGKKVKAMTYDGFFSSYKYPWDIFTINEYLMNKLVTKSIIEENVVISEKATIQGNVWIAKGTHIMENVTIKGPCYIGEKSLICTNSLILSYSSLGANTVSGFSTEIKNSIIGDDCWFHTNYIGDSIVGDNCSFGSGAVTANFRFDEEKIKVNIKDEKVDSGRNKLGTITADNCRIGVNASLSPGVKIGPNSIVGPNTFLKSDLGSNKIIIIKDESYEIKENKLDLSIYRKDKLRSKLKM